MSNSTLEKSAPAERCYRALKPFSVIVTLLLTLLLTGSGAFADAGEDESTPANPQEFHDQEFARIGRALEAESRQPLTSAQDDYDAVYYDLTLDLRGYYTHTIAGDVTVFAHSVVPNMNEMVLDLCSALTVDSVFSGGSLRSFSSDSNLLHITLDRNYGVGDLVQVRVVYHGTPCQTNSPYTSVQFYDRYIFGYHIPSLATLSEPFGARDWWPSKNVVSDKADSVRVSLIVADTLTATSNGVLQSVTTIPPSSRMFTWVERHPISTYLVCANATDYAHYSDQYITLSGDTMPIEHYVYPERLNQARISWNGLPAMMTFIAQLIGEYPFVDEKYGHTMFNFGGGMEHQTNTSYGRTITNGAHNFDYIVEHELFHQWHGDEVTLATWPDIWLNEGFATYSEALWNEHLGGFNAYHNFMITTGYLAVTDPSGPVYNPTDLFSSNSVYNKGAWILHMLRGVVRNDSVFFAALRAYRENHAYGNATTADFLADVSDVIGYNVTPYLYAYLYLTNRPHYAVSYGTARVDGDEKTVVRIRQTQTNPGTTFQTRLDLRFSEDEDTERVCVENSQWEQRYYVTLPFETETLLVDPDDWVLKQVAFEPLPLTIMNDTLPEATVGESYTESLRAIGSSMRLTWALLDANRPPGLTLYGIGTLRGVPTSAGTFVFHVQADDGQSHADKTELTLRIHPPLVPPHDVTALPEDGELLGLRWSPVAEADSYHVYRAVFANLNPMQLLTTTADTFALDSLAGLDPDSMSHRFYQVTAVRR